MLDLVGNPEDWFSRVAAHIMISFEQLLLLKLKNKSLVTSFQI